MMSTQRFSFTFILFAVVAAAQTPSDKLNQELPKWLRFRGEYRARIEGFTGGGFRDGFDDGYFLNRVRINMKIEANSWFRVVFQGQDARAFDKDKIPNGPPYQDSMDLRIGYLELGDPDSKPFSLRAGRQELVFGDQRLIGNLNWTNTARSFDAVRATFRCEGYRLDAFASSVVIMRDGEFGRPIAGNNFHGLYGDIEKLVPKATIEPYVLWRLSPGNVDFKTYGLRWVGKLPASFDYNIESAMQRGSLGAQDLRAWAGHALLGYTISGVSWQPRLIGEYNYASGNQDPRGRVRGTFDQLYPTGHDKYGLADQVGWRNIEDMRFGVELRPSAKWLLVENFHNWWLASANDGLYNAAGAMIVNPVNGRVSRHVGEELDQQAVYTLSKQVQIGAGFAHIFPGAFLKEATPGRPYNFPYLMVTYSF